MGEIKQANIKNRTYYFYNDIINLDEFDGSKIKVDQKNFNDIDIYYLGYEYKKKITECNDINNVNPLYLRIKDMKGQFKKGKSDNLWYLIMFGDTDVLTEFANIWKSTPSRQILVLRTSRGRLPPTSPGRSLKIFLTVPGTSRSDVLGTSQSDFLGTS